MTEQQQDTVPTWVLQEMGRLQLESIALQHENQRLAQENERLKSENGKVEA